MVKIDTLLIPFNIREEVKTMVQSREAIFVDLVVGAGTYHPFPNGTLKISIFLACIYSFFLIDTLLSTTWNIQFINYSNLKFTFPDIQFSILLLEKVGDG